MLVEVAKGETQSEANDLGVAIALLLLGASLSLFSLSLSRSFRSFADALGTAARLYDDDAILLDPSAPPPVGAPGPPRLSSVSPSLTSSLSLSRNAVSKERIRTRLQWILEVFPAVNPSRAVLNRVNDFAMSRR